MSEPCRPAKKKKKVFSFDALLPCLFLLRLKREMNESIYKYMYAAMVFFSDIKITEEEEKKRIIKSYQLRKK